ncbi:MAG: hypothetical protein Fur0037_25520 [Planctomycetota bacterium]
MVRGGDHPDHGIRARPGHALGSPVPPSPLRVHAALIAVSLLFGANYVFTKRILEVVPPASWVMIRIAAAAALLLLLAAKLGRGRPPASAVSWLLVASILGVSLNQVLFTEGLSRTRSEHSAVINACIPTWTLLLAVLFRQERLSWSKALSVAAALAGVLVLMRADELLGAGRTGHPAWMTAGEVAGDLLTLGNGVSFSLHLLIVRRIGSRVDPWIATALMFAMAALMVPAYSLPRMAFEDLARIAEPPVLWFALYAVLAATVLTYSLNTWALRHTHSSQVALYINAQPIVAAALGSWFGMPAPDWRFFAAVAGVGTGLWLQTRKA